MSDSGLELQVLGGFQVLFASRPLPGFGYDKMRALLAYLALERPQDHRRETLAELLWSSSDAATARGNLRRTLSDLRRVLEVPSGRTLFEVTRSTIRFVPDLCIDALRFADDSDGATLDAQARCIALYRGELLAGFQLPDCPEFAHWLLQRRESLHRRALSLLERLADACEGAGDIPRALKFALQQVELEPWDEAACRRAMRLHAAHGGHGAALALFDALDRALRHELGAAPGPETRALAERLRDGAGQVPSALSPAPASPPPAERRQVTVLYCELTLAGLDDPDDALERLQAPRERCLAILQDMGGHVVPTHGGGLLAYFGVPRPVEAAALRAVQAGLALACESVAGLRIRSGVHTGVIITGSPAAPDSIGTVSRLAQELRRCIAGDGVVISRETHDIVAGHVDCSPLGERALLDGLPPVEVLRVERDRGTRGRIEAARSLAPLAGRREELARLQALWQDARQQGLRAALLQGDAGIGKSRLLHALQQQLRQGGQPHVTRELRCLPEFSQSAFTPLLALLQAEAGLSPDDAPAVAAQRLARWIAASGVAVPQDAAPQLASLYFAPLQPRGTAAAPQRSSTGPAQDQRKDQTTALLLALLEGLAAQQPALLAVEDLHWADPSTLQLLGLLLQRRRAGPLLAVFTARPEFVPGWPADAMTTLSLGPLARDETRQLVQSLHDGLPEATVQKILQRADGVPLFVEELVRMAPRADWGSVPTTLHDLLAALVDRLGPARHTAQRAATLGREFSLLLLRRLCRGPQEAVDRELRALMAAGILQALDAEHLQFRHALIHEVAYQSQTRPDRQAAHREVARLLASDFADMVTLRPELLARHLAAGGETAAAVEQWTRAGQRAVLVSANVEAVAHFRAGLALLDVLPPTPARHQAEFTLLVGLGPALHATQGYGAEETSRITERLSSLRALMADSPAFFLSEWSRLRNRLAAIGPRGVPDEAATLLQLAGDDPVRRQAAHYVGAIALFWLGEFDRSRAAAEQATALYRPEQHAAMLEWFGEDLSVSFAGHRCWTLCFLGRHAEALEGSTQLLAQARAMGHPKTMVMALLFASTLARWQERHADTLQLAGEAVALTREQGMSHWMGTSRALQMWARAMTDAADDPGELRTLVTQLGQASPSYAAWRLVGLAQVLLRRQRHAEALAVVQQAQAEEARSGCRQSAAELQRLEGVCRLALSPGDSAAAEACFERAMAVCREQGATSLALRAALDLARLWQQRGQAQRARRLVETACAGMAPGSGGVDLREAGAFLQQAEAADGQR